MPRLPAPASLLRGEEGELVSRHGRMRFRLKMDVHAVTNGCASRYKRVYVHFQRHVHPFLTGCTSVSKQVKKIEKTPSRRLPEVAGAAFFFSPFPRRLFLPEAQGLGATRCERGRNMSEARPQRVASSPRTCCALFREKLRPGGVAFAYFTYLCGDRKAGAHSSRPPCCMTYGVSV